MAVTLALVVLAIMDVTGFVMTWMLSTALEKLEHDLTLQRDLEREFERHRRAMEKKRTPPGSSYMDYLA